MAETNGIVAVGEYEFECLTAPVPDALRRELISLWEQVFRVGFFWLNEVLAGKEVQSNTDTLYLARFEGTIVASCRLTVSLVDPRLGGIGEVVTAPEHQGKGLSGTLCRQAAEAFADGGGEALFLATDNPVARRMYTKLGWLRLPNSAVMLRTRPDVLPEEFMVDYFRGGLDLAVEIRRGAPNKRLPMVPLILTPHPWVTLDVNTGMTSIRYARQQSCEGLYTRYEALGEPGTWFAAVRSDGAVVGLATVRKVDGSFCLDAFTHPRYQDTWLAPLHETALNHARGHGATKLYTLCVRADVLKKSAVKSLGFRRTDRRQRADLMGRAFDAVVYEWKD